jgi:hypothetical protein
MAADTSKRKDSHMSSRSLFRSLLAVFAVAALAPATASAGALVADAKSCDTQAFSQVFLPWADPASYTLHPGGDFEAGSPAWELSGGASRAAGNEPWSVGSISDSSSLSLPAGSGATSGVICVGIEHPDIRFFAKASDPLATLRVEVLFEDASGAIHSAPIGSLAGNNGWSLTPPYAIVANLLPLLPGSKTPVAFRFSAAGGDWTIDDLYVDPYARW